jgi:hypothetical protein
MLVHGSDMALSLGYSLLGRSGCRRCTSTTCAAESSSSGAFWSLRSCCRCTTSPQYPLSTIKKGLQRIVHGFPPPQPPCCTVEGDAGLFYVMMQAAGGCCSAVLRVRCDVRCSEVEQRLQWEALLLQSEKDVAHTLQRRQMVQVGRLLFNV